MDTTETRTAITGEADPIPGQAAIEFVVHPPLVNVRLMRAGGKVCAVGQINTQRGPITITATADEKLIKWAMSILVARRIAQGKLPTTAAGAMGDWIKETSAKVAQAKVIRGLLDQAKAVGANPQIARAVGLSTVVVPGPGSAVLALQSASELLQGLQRRDPRSIQSWRRLSAQAKLGNVKARRTMHVLHAVARAPRIVSRH